MRTSLWVVAALALAGAPVGAESGRAWLHVRVEEPQRASRVHVNLPLPVVEAAIKERVKALTDRFPIYQ